MNERDVFTGALARSAGSDRAAFLDEACAGDSALRSRVERLLALHEDEDSLFDQPSVDAGSIPHQPLDVVGWQSGRVIAGRYTLAEKLGEGGMGEVWAAQQTEPVRRMVAIKMIRSGLNSRAVVERFENEKQALAVLDHAHIARVFDGGATADGHPYFVMELVNGVPLDKYCDENRLTPQERLELFVPVCRAVQHAHQKGLVHRDLKPANILIEMADGRPVPKVIDFGVAKATGDRLTDVSMATLPGAIVGTLEYMSPEQADPGLGNVDTRADIYALGVILYELLTGLRPFSSERLKRAALLEMVRIIRDEEPSRPSTRLSTADAMPSLAAARQTDPKRLTALLRGDLDWVVMRCLEKQPDRRYGSADGLARDIQRFLANEPVEARPPTRRYRLSKFLRRNRGPVVAAGLLLATLIAGLIGTSWGLVTSRRAVVAERKAKSEAIAEKQVADAVRGFLQDRLLGQANVFAQANSLEAIGRPASLARPGVTVRELLDRAAGDLTPEALSARFPDQPLVHAGLLQTVGETYVGLGVYDRGIPLLRRAVSLKLEHLGENDQQSLIASQQLANACTRAGKLTEAIELTNDVIRRMTVTLGPNDRETLNARNTLANALLVAGRAKESLAEYEALLPLVSTHLGLGDRTTLAVRSGLAQACRASGDRTRAATLYQEAYDAQLAARGPDHPDTLSALSDLAVGYEESGKTAEALGLYIEAHRRTAERLGPDHSNTLIAAGNLAGAYQRRGQAAKALPIAEEVSRRFEATLGTNHPDTITSLSNLAGAYKANGQFPKAAEINEDVLKRSLATLGPDHPATLRSRSNLAVGYSQMGRWEAAVPIFEQVLADRTAKLGANHPDTINTNSNLAYALLNRGPVERGVAACEEAAKRAATALGARSSEALQSRNYLSKAYLAAGRTADVVEVLTALLPDQKAVLGPEHPNTVETLANLGSALVDLNRHGEAEPHLRECLTIREKVIPNDWRTANTRAKLGAALLGQKKYALADPLLLKGYEEMKQREKAIPATAAGRIPEAIDRLIELYQATQQPERVKKWQAERAKYPPPKPN